MIEYVSNEEKLLAIIIRSGYKKEGINFFTPNEFSQQLAYMNHPKGHVIQPHLHNYVVREVQYTQEVIYIKSGKVRVDFYNEKHTFLKNRILVTGDVILLASGGHGFEMLEASEMIEVKQGPYIGDSDKTRFLPL